MGQQAPLDPATKAAVEARKGDLDRTEQSETEALRAKRTLAAMPGQLRIELGPLIDTRSAAPTGVTGSAATAGTLTLQLRIYAEDIPTTAIMGRFDVLTAVDNENRPIRRSSSPTAAYVLESPGGRGQATGYLRTMLFQSPRREAKAIKLIEGTVTFVIPTEESGSIVRVPRVGEWAGKKLELPALTKSEVEVTLLTSELFDSLKADWANSQAVAAANVPNWQTMAAFLINDPKGRFVTLEVQDPAGVRLQTTTSSTTTTMPGLTVVRATLGKPLPADARLHLVIAAPEAAVKTYPFRLENIPLP